VEVGSRRQWDCEEYKEQRILWMEGNKGLLDGRKATKLPPVAMLWTKREATKDPKTNSSVVASQFQAALKFSGIA
jgi:hypothetical protein